MREEDGPRPRVPERVVLPRPEVGDDVPIRIWVWPPQPGVKVEEGDVEKYALRATVVELPGPEAGVNHVQPDGKFRPYPNATVQVGPFRFKVTGNCPQGWASSAMQSTGALPKIESELVAYLRSLPSKRVFVEPGLISNSDEFGGWYFVIKRDSQA